MSRPLRTITKPKRFETSQSTSSTLGSASAGIISSGAIQLQEAISLGKREKTYSNSSSTASKNKYEHKVIIDTAFINMI
jgi:hypothetical protein